MNKDTIEIDMRKEFPVGYGVIRATWDESTVLHSIIKWSKSQIPERKVYKHLTRVEFENIDMLNTYKPFNGEREYEAIHLCDRVVYLDIYWQ